MTDMRTRRPINRWPSTRKTAKEDFESFHLTMRRRRRRSRRNSAKGVDEDQSIFETLMKNADSKEDDIGLKKTRWKSLTTPDLFLRLRDNKGQGNVDMSHWFTMDEKIMLFARAKEIYEKEWEEMKLIGEEVQLVGRISKRNEHKLNKRKRIIRTNGLTNVNTNANEHRKR